MRFWTAAKCTEFVRVLRETFLNDHLLKKDNTLRYSRNSRVREQTRESLNTQTQSPHFQSRSGILNHTGGTYSHSGMMDPRTPVAELNLGNRRSSGPTGGCAPTTSPTTSCSRRRRAQWFSEWNLGKFPGSLEFQRSKVSFRTVVCVRTADPQVITQRIKEVEVAKSIDELVTSRSITCVSHLS